MSKKILVVGAGLAGSDCAYFLANNGIKVVLCESKRIQKTPAQKLETCGELVCTNSLKSKALNSAHGLLKNEMNGFGSLVLEAGRETEVPAGDALAVDRDKFSALISEKLNAHENIELISEEVKNPLETMKKYECEYVVVASGPLTLSGLETWIVENLGKDDLYFYDAIAPIVDADSLDISKMYFKDRHKDPEGESADYLNIPLTEEQYYEFVEDLNASEKVPAQNFEDYKYFESCLPIDVMAER